MRAELQATGDPRAVIVDPAAKYFGTPVGEDSLVPSGPAPRLAPTRHADWLAKRAATAKIAPAAVTA